LKPILVTQLRLREDGNDVAEKLLNFCLPYLSGKKRNEITDQIYISNDKMTSIKIRNLDVCGKGGRSHLYSPFTKKTFSGQNDRRATTLFEFTFSITNVRHDEELVEEMSRREKRSKVDVVDVCEKLKIALRRRAELYTRSKFRDSSSVFADVLRIFVSELLKRRIRNTLEATEEQGRNKNKQKQERAARMTHCPRLLSFSRNNLRLPASLPPNLGTLLSWHQVMPLSPCKQLQLFP